MKGTLIKVKYTIKGRIPDGDTVCFRPTTEFGKKAIWPRGWRTQKSKAPACRLQAIDTLEKNQDVDLATDARDFLLRGIGFKSWSPNRPDEIYKKNKEAVPENPSGYVLVVGKDTHGRYISFVFGDLSGLREGEYKNVPLNLVRRSVNWQLAQTGHAYPLFYEGLPQAVMSGVSGGVKKSRAKPDPLWAADIQSPTREIVTRNDLKRRAIWPKLHRRLYEYLGKNVGLGAFLDWLKADPDKRNDQMMVIGGKKISAFDKHLVVTGNRIRLRENPERLLVVSRAEPMKVKPSAKQGR